ncbi:MAG TPA: MarR family transcriptional regulator [Acidimicrobiales bacterium]|jgi:DNA-binding MarR family transcriptional regulator|nr:MarR family transcriptional regulator [Acidimicrobiales bacterium]
MAHDPLIEDVAGALQASVRLLVQRLRQTQAVDGDLTSSETSALARLDRTGPTTAAELARLERISPQSMGATTGALEERGFVERGPDPSDGRRAILSLTPPGAAWLKRRRSARSEHLSAALESAFTRAELKQLQVAAPLIERLAQHI